MRNRPGFILSNPFGRTVRCAHGAESGTHVGTGTAPYRCNYCDRQFTVRTGRFLEHSRIPLHFWLRSIVIFATARSRVSGRKLAAFLRISQPAAWGMIRRLRSVWDDLMENFPALLDQAFLDFVCRRRQKSGPLWWLSVDRCSGYALWYSLESIEGLLGKMKNFLIIYAACSPSPGPCAR
jgi:transposase-like protein